jgi:hypothetical protein
LGQHFTVIVVTDNVFLHNICTVIIVASMQQ